MSQTIVGLTLLGVWILVCALQVAHGTSISIAALELAAGLYCVGGWLGGEISLKQSIGDIYRSFRAGHLPPMSSLSKNMQVAAAVVALVAIADYLTQHRGGH
jgi:hypothetical protein